MGAGGNPKRQEAAPGFFLFFGFFLPPRVVTLLLDIVHCVE